jgi:hypothetical protein
MNNPQLWGPLWCSMLISPMQNRECVLNCLNFKIVEMMLYIMCPCKLVSKLQQLCKIAHKHIDALMMYSTQTMMCNTKRGDKLRGGQLCVAIQIAGMLLAFMFLGLWFFASSFCLVAYASFSCKNLIMSSMFDEANF